MKNLKNLKNIWLNYNLDAIRSYVDKKKYHKFKLDSGLEVLIIRGKKNKNFFHLMINKIKQNKTN